MLLRRWESDGTHDSSKNAAIGTDSKHSAAAFQGRRAQKQLSIDGTPIRPPGSSLRDLHIRFDRLHLRHGNGGNPRRRPAPRSRLEPLPYELENGSPILRNDFHPRHFPHHREIDAAETETRDEDVKAIPQGLVAQR